MIAKVEIVPVPPRRGLVAFASCETECGLHLDGIAIHSRRYGTGFRLVFPTKALANGRSLDLYYPFTKAAGKTLTDAIVGAYVELMGLDGSSGDDVVSASALTA